MDHENPNPDRAAYGEEAVAAAASQTGAWAVEDVETATRDVLAYIAHFVDQFGGDPAQVFADGLESYHGDFEDGPGVDWDKDRFPDRGATLNPEYT